jgi:predicted RNA binding protein YcfA (HicA-like mRNA interferase family)
VKGRHVIESAEIIRRLTNDGWAEVSQKGSHRTFKKEGVAHLITIPHPRKDLGKGLRSTIHKAAGWK